MKITGKQKFNRAINVVPGDILTVTYLRNGAKMASLRAVIKEKQILDCAILVEYTSEEAKALGLESAFGTFAGKMQ